ncbi:60S ribosomal protein L39-like [Artibeus jamaicensis]|uniref:60S ribosomal protein L39-like n=1 Tax=Artibeus jamaicensis TaxID=9417 RepID=UPI00187CF404|nr:60S ribosomal protein L39-like [Artibeus jamaicensis]
MFSHKTFRIKRLLAKKQEQNQPIPQWIQRKTGNKIRYHSKRRHWKRTKLKVPREVWADCGFCKELSGRRNCFQRLGKHDLHLAVDFL